MSEVKVQVVCVTYNQKDYIKDALDSFLMQKTNFKFEVLVGDDCSTDGTSEIVAEYAQKYPDIIKHIRREPNMGCLANFMDLCESVTAKYVAFCDGDDYWTDENKLQKQFDFMEEHEDVNVCAHKTLIKADKSWNLYNYYKNRKEPFVLPNIKCNKRLTLKDIISEWPNSSSLFIRLKIHSYPNWAKINGKEGISSIIFLNLGIGYCYIFPDIMSHYRRTETGASLTKNDVSNHFLETRNEYFRILSNSINYYKLHYNSFDVWALEKRLWSEIINYTNAIIETGKFEKISELKETYPEAYNKIIALLSEYKYRLQQINKLGLKQANLLRSNSTLRIIRPILAIINRLKTISKQCISLLKNIHKFIAYWLFALVPKKKNLIVFSGFKKINYMDNTKYLFEYIVKNHPELEVIWVSRDKSVRKHLREHKLPVCGMTSLQAIWTTARANAVILDHWKMCDLDSRYGYNTRTKVIQLWHGNGFKNMKPDGDIIKSTSFKGVRLSSDIICQKGDSLLTKIKKKIKYIFISPFREMFENYFLMFSPGPGFDESIIKPWKIKPEIVSYCGYSKHKPLFLNKDIKPNKYKIVYAPTYRGDAILETNLINNLISNFENLNILLEKIDAYFTIRLHPHTWRSYSQKIKQHLKNYTRIEFNTEKDFDQFLYDYSIMITDYSSMGMEFPILDRPVIYLAHDLKEYQMVDATLAMPLEGNVAGDILYNWSDVNKSIEEAYYHPEKNVELRKTVLDKYFPSEYNDINNSKRIVEEIERRLKIRRKNG